MTDLQVLSPLRASPKIFEAQTGQKEAPKTSEMQDHPKGNSLSLVVFVRSRIFYARPALNAKGKVTFGLRHIRRNCILRKYHDILRCNRCTESLFKFGQFLSHKATSEVHLSQAIWAAQCLYVFGGQTGNRSALQRLHAP